MKICILNGNPDAGNQEFDGYLAGLVAGLAGKHQSEVLELRGLNIDYCMGCFGCMVKTPGECVNRDDSELVCRRFINSDLEIFASPMRLGFVSSLLKKNIDKLLPLLHPYCMIDQGVMQHLKRYKKYPLVGLLLQSGSDYRVQDQDITSAIMRCTAHNLKSRLVFSKMISEPSEEVCYEIDRL